MGEQRQVGDDNVRAVQAAEELLVVCAGDIVAARQALTHAARLRLEQMHSKREVSDEVVVQVRNLAKSYKVGKQHVQALGGVDVTVHRGEFVALVGPSGSGKSTLLQLIGGLDAPTDGMVEVTGQQLAKLRDSALSRFRNQTIGFVFQFFYLQPFLTVRQNLEVAGIPAGTKSKVRRARVDELAELVGLSDRLAHYPRELSGGQMQRAAIARALLNNPQIILADEPTGNLDSTNGRAIIDLFERIRDEFGTTIIVVTHDPTIAARADRIVRLRDGRLA